MKDLKKLALFLQTLGVENRLSIIDCIGMGSKSVGEIVKQLGLSQPLVSHHLKSLREKQILVTDRKGAFIYYRLKNQRLVEALGTLSEIARVLRDESKKEDCATAHRSSARHRGNYRRR